MSEGNAPLILTAQLPDDLHARYTALRDAYFPAERNYLEAHVTLFHALPGMCQGEVVTVCERMARDFAPVAGEVVGLMSLGRGTAIKLESPAMLRLRDLLADGFHGLLTQQDRHRPRLHVTIQNKVSGKEAKALQAQLDGTILPRRCTFPCLSLFHYRGRHSKHVQTLALRGKDTE